MERRLSKSGGVDDGRGVLYGLAAYGIWGAFPLYFHLLRRSAPVEIVLHRVLWSLLVCLLATAVLHRRHELVDALRRPALVARLALAAALLALNWGIYIYGVISGQVVQASLGYFVNPLVTVLLGVVVLHERLRPAQWIAVAIGTLAVAMLTIDYGAVPWIALTLAVSFAGYGLIKKQVAQLEALTSLTTETVVLAPLAAAVLAWFELTGRGHFSANPPWQGLLLASVGVATVVPLLLFGAAARRVPLSTVGLMQYLTPVLQLLCGVLLLGEHMPPSRWFGFSLVWLALLVLSADSLRALRHNPATARTSGPAGPAPREPVTR